MQPRCFDILEIGEGTDQNYKEEKECPGESVVEERGPQLTVRWFAVLAEGKDVGNAGEEEHRRTAGDGSREFKQDFKAFDRYSAGQDQNVQDHCGPEEIVV